MAGKKSGKKAGKQAVEEQVVQSQEAAQDGAAKGRKNKFIDLSQDLIREVNGKDGKSYMQVSFPKEKDEAGKIVWGKFLVSPGQVMQATKQQGDSRVPIPGRVSVLLGTENQKYDVSYDDGTVNEKGKPNYPHQSMTCAEIKDAVVKAKSDYYAAKKDKAVEKEVPEVAQEEASAEVELEG